MIDKERIQELLNSSPESVVIEDFIDKLIINAKLERALDELERGQFLTSEQVDDEIEKW